ncbi:MAG TPA: 2-phosphosulfolactate phosphatase [Trueperaceae bacterium]
MRVRIDLLPRDGYAGESVVLIDVLKLSTVAPLLFDKGLERLVVCGSIRGARQAAEGGRLLVGERGGVPPEGFNHASSPSLLQKYDFGGRQAVLVSDNGPRALPQVTGASLVLLGSLYNARAVAQAVLDSGAERVSLVCCGHQGQEDLDDAMAAGFLAGEIGFLAREMGQLAGDVELEGAARLAVGLLRAFPDPIEALWHSAAGRDLRRMELGEDLAVASAISQSRHVPRLSGVEEGKYKPLYHFEALPLAG